MINWIFTDKSFWGLSIYEICYQCTLGPLSSRSSMVDDYTVKTGRIMNTATRYKPFPRRWNCLKLLKGLWKWLETEKNCVWLQCLLLYLFSGARDSKIYVLFTSMQTHKKTLFSYDLSYSRRNTWGLAYVYETFHFNISRYKWLHNAELTNPLVLLKQYLTIYRHLH